MIKQVVTTLRMYPLTDAVAIGLRQRLDAAGTLDPDEAMEGAATSMLDEPQRLAPALAAVRSGPAVTA